MFKGRLTFPRANELKVYDWLCILVATLGIIFVFLVPPFQSPDEQTHFYRAYQISEGHIIGKKLSYGSGDTLPKSLSDSFDSYYYLLFNPNAKVSNDIYRKSLNAPLNTKLQIETRFENTVVYPPASYLPQTVGILLGRLFSLNPILLLYLARIASLAFWVFAVRFIVKRFPRAALPMFAFALLPIVLFQASSASADIVTTAIALCFTFESIRAFTRKISQKDIRVLVILGILLGLCKFPYGLLILLPLFIPKSNFLSSKAARNVKIILAVCLVLSFAWVAIANATFVNLKDGVNTPIQLHYMVTQPWNFLKILLRTYVFTNGDLLYLQMIGVLGWLDTKIPFWTTLSSFAAILLATLANTGSKLIKPLKSKFRLISLTLLFILVVMISSLLYLTWNVPRSPVIEGLQGRYFLPLFGLLYAAVGGTIIVDRRSTKLVRNIVIVLSLLSAISTIVTVTVRYYSLT